MKKVGWLSRLSNQQTSTARMQRIAGGFGAAIFLLMTGIAAAQIPTPSEPMAVPEGYKSHETVDIGGHIANIKGSGAMYDTLINQQSGPRILGATYEMHALPGKKNTLVDSLHAIASGLGGDPYNFAKLDFSKGKIYEFAGTFRRDRQYFDYDLLSNPNINTGLSIPITGSTTPLAWPQVMQSPVMFNTVRRMTDTNLTLFPLSKVTYRAGYSQNIFQGPSLSPGESVGKYDALLSEYQRNSTDEFTGAVDWKPVERTKLTFEEVINHFKTGSYFTLAPGDFLAQEADGTRVSLGNWDSQTAYSTSACAASSMGGHPLLSPAPAGGLPIINPACDVATSYLRSQPTRILTPTEIFRFQSSSIKNVSMNGDASYTSANMNLPNYYEQFQGLDVVTVSTSSPIAGGVRSAIFTGSASAQRKVVSADYGVVWQAIKTFSISDQFDYSDVHQPGTSNISSGATLDTPTTAGNETINYSGTLITGSPMTVGGSPNGVPLPDYFGQKILTNSLTGTWDAASRATLSITYRYRTHTIAEGIPYNAPLALGADNNGTVTINESGGIFNAALRPANHWDLNGTVEALYDDNAFTPVGPRQTRHYRVHTTYKPRPWATFSAAYNDLERHNNTNNNQASVAYEAIVAASATPPVPTSLPFEGPLNHVDHSRVVSFGTVLAPNEHYGFDFNYAYSDVYASTNICYLNGSPTPPAGASVSQPGAVQTATAVLCPGIFARNSTTILSEWIGRDFMDAPTQYVSAALHLSPVDKIHTNIGYRISNVNGTRFFNDARDVNGSLVSKYQSPFMNLAYTIHKGWMVKAEYNFFQYGEGGPSGSPYCSTATSVAGESSIVPCTSASLTGPTGLTEPTSGLTAPRTFRANNVTISMHYEF
ncbi:MAG TPA: hypothetical protein VKF63_14635 [Terracidiphilus sp.]|nr:hypothetical protein [Terracidiphilus sp.]